MIRFTLAMSGLNAVKARMRQAHANVGRAKARLNGLAIAEVMRWIDNNFRDQGAAYGGWQRVSEQTLARRRSGSGSGSPLILVDTGLLKSNWQTFSNSRGGKVVSGTDYGKKHDEGKGVPQRKILPTNKIMAPILRRIYAKGVKDLIERGR